MSALLICVIVTQEFLDFSKNRGNDLISPALHVGFPGLKAGDRWCVCVNRWKEACEAGCAPPVIAESTHELVLNFVSLQDLIKSNAFASLWLY